jgi:hypothetical protein
MRSASGISGALQGRQKVTSFDRREDAFEAIFAHHEELAFKARARALRMLGLWAAGKRGLTGIAAENYAGALIDLDISGAPDAAVDKLATDLAGNGFDARQIREKRDAVLAIAQRSLASSLA